MPELRRFAEWAEAHGSAFDRDVAMYLRRAGPYSGIAAQDDKHCWAYVRRWVALNA